MKNLFLAGMVVLCLAACEQTAAPEKPTNVVKTSTDAKDIGNRGEVMMAIQAHGRPEADKKDDEIRKASDVLQFTGVWPGMTLVELEAGKGYYTELLSHIVGKDGKVYMQNPHGF